MRLATWALLTVAVAFLGYLGGFPAGFGVPFAVAGVVVAFLLRSGPLRSFDAYAPTPILLVLVLEAAFAPIGFGTELIAGLSGVAFLVWLADDPLRPAGGPQRAFLTLAIPTLALGIAWSSALILPTGAFPIGVGGALLAFTLVAVAYLVGRPTLFDREEA